MSADPPFDPDERRDLERYAELAKSMTVADTHLEAPPADLWSSIEAAVEADATTEGTVPASPEPELITNSSSPATETSNVTNLAEGRRQPERQVGRMLLGIAAVLLLVALVGVGLIKNDNADDTNLIAAVELGTEGIDPDGLGLDGNAELFETDDGYEIALDVSSLPEIDGFYELWIIDTEVDGMYSLGTVNADGRFAVPDGVDVADFPIVDLSVEPTDGDPTHSGVSALRGVLDI